YEIKTEEECSPSTFRVRRQVEPTEEYCPKLFRFLQGTTPVCVDCENPYEKCEVKSFELPQTINKGFLGWKEYIKGAVDPKFLAYYQKFPEGEEKSWQFESKTLFMIGLGVRATFTTLIPFSGAMKFWKVNKLVRLTEGLEGLDGAARARRLKRIGKQLDRLKEAGRLDEGLEALVKLNTRGLAGVNAEVITDDVAGKILKEIADIRANPTLFKSSVLDSHGIPVGGKFTSEGENTLRSAMSKIKTESGLNYRLANKGVDDLISAASEARITDAADVAKILRGADDIDVVAEGVARAVSVTRLGQIGKKIGFKKMIRAYLKKDKEGNIIGGSLEKPLRKGLEGLKELKKIDPDFYKRAIEETDTLMKEFIKIDDAGNLIADFNALFGKVDVDILANILRTADDVGRPTALGVHVGEMSDLLNAKTWGKGTLYGSVKATFGDIKGVTKAEQAKSFIT
ncbi:unnamed protein product, partial [marine sediment metagenome]